MVTRHTEDDFGITNLASMFFQGWSSSHDDARALVRSYVFDIESLAPVLVLAEDAMRLVASGDAKTVGVLWECVTAPDHRLAWEGVDGLQWMREIVQLCEDRLLASKIKICLKSKLSIYYAFRNEVAQEIEALRPLLHHQVDEHAWAAVPGVVDALSSCALNICPELAFRMLIRVLIQYRCHIDMPQYLRFVELGKKFSYGEFVVSRAEFLVR